MTDLADRELSIDLSPERSLEEFWSRPRRERRVPKRRPLLDSLLYAPLQTWVTVVVVAACVIFTMAQLHPELIFTNTIPTGGDFGAHVWGPAYLRDHLLPHGRLSGWAPDWYAGFPMYHFYMVVPALFVVLVDIVLPYGIALKIVSVLGLITLPIALAVFARCAGLRYPIPPLFAVAATWFLFDESFKIYGGNIASTMAGEYSFSIALSFGFFALAALVHGLRTGRGRARVAALFALCALCHLIVCFFALIAALTLFLFYVDRHRLRYVLTLAPVVALLVSFWMLPFWARRHFMTDMRYERRPVGNAPNGLRDSYWQMLFPQGVLADRIIFALAVIGLVGSIIRMKRIGMWLGVLTLGYGLWACVWPQSHLWNARLLPFMYLTRYLLCALGVVEIIRTTAWLIGQVRHRWVAPVQAIMVGSSALACGVMLAMGLRILPGGHVVYQKVTKADGSTKDTWHYNWGPFTSDRSAFVDGWAKWNFAGYQAKKGYGEYRGIITTMQNVCTTVGPGRAHWEYTEKQTNYGTTMAMMLLPFWTNGCIGSMEGLFFESSATTPYHFMSASALSAKPSNPVRSMPYSHLDVAKGVDELRLLGVRYYLAFSSEAVAQADQNPYLREVARSGVWHVYEVSGSELVTPLAAQPVVATGVGTTATWLDLGVKVFNTPDLHPVTFAASGPPQWQRVAVVPDPKKPAKSTTFGFVKFDPQPETVSLEPVTVTDIRTGDDFVSFHVDRVGVPVLVKTSYFPNWEVAGADGPYRVAPNQMVVIPRRNDVRLHYGRTPVDLAASGLTIAGLAGLVVLWRLGPVPYPTPVVRRRRGEPMSMWSAPEAGDQWLFEWEDDLDQLLEAESLDQYLSWGAHLDGADVITGELPITVAEPDLEDPVDWSTGGTAPVETGENPRVEGDGQLA